MKILYLTDQYKPEAYTGTIKVVENITNYFSKNNEIKIIAYSNNDPSEYKQINSIKYWRENVDSVECIKFSTEEKKEINYQLFNNEVYEFAMKMIEDFNPDIIHICHLKRVASFVQAAIDLNKKYIITCTDTFLVCSNSFLFDNDCNICIQRHKKGICTKQCGYNNEIIEENKKIVQRYVNNAYALVVDSDFQIDIFSEYFNKQVLVIHHGNKENNQYMIHKDYPKEKLIFNFHGNSSAIKGLIIAIGAFNKLSDEINVELHVYGECDDTVKLLAGKKIKFYGRYDNSEVSKILSESDFLICPSICYENYPFVITEAFMNKVPVIVSNEGGMKKLIKNCVNGFTFNRGDSEHLAEIVKYLFTNQQIIPDLIHNLEKYKSKTVIDEMLEYSELYKKCFNDEEITIQYKSEIEKNWESIIEDNFHFNDIKNYKKVIEKVEEKYKYPINVDMKYRFIIRLKNMEKVMKENKEKSIIIWGSGMSGKLTIEILSRLYKDINIEFIVDKFKYNGEFNNIPIVNI